MRCKMMGKACLRSPALPRMTQKRRINSPHLSESGSSPGTGPFVNQHNPALHRQSTSTPNQAFEPLLVDNVGLPYHDSSTIDLTDSGWTFREDHNDPICRFPSPGSHSTEYGEVGVSMPPSILSTASVPGSSGQSPDYRDTLNSATDLELPQATRENLCSPWRGSLRNPSNHSVGYVNHAETEQNRPDFLRGHEQKCTCISKLLLSIQTVHGSSAVAIDVTLKMNREAIASCWSVVECSCTEKLNLIIIACGLLELVLNSYQAALDNICGNSPDVSLMMASIPQFHSVEITVGDFGIEKEDRKFFLQELIIRGIRKIDDNLLPAIRPILGSEAQNLIEALVSHLSRKSKDIMAHRV